MRQILWATVVALLAVSLLFTFQPANIQTNLFSLLPSESSGSIPQATIDQYSEKLSRKVIFLVSAANREAVIEDADNMYSLLVESQIFSEIRFRISEAELKAIYQTFEPYQFNMLTETARSNLQSEPEKWLSRKFIDQFISPIAGVDSQSLKVDPFGLYRDFLTKLPRGNQSAEIENGYTFFKTKTQVHLLVTAELADSAFSQDMQNAFQKLMLEINKIDENASAITVFGVIRYALENRLLAQQEMSTIGLGSLLGIIFIFFFVFRKISLLAYILIPIVIGVLSAFSIGMLLFGEIHLVSLVFAASLIGVSIDYTLHYCCSNSNLSTATTAKQALLTVRSALTIGLVTSSLGYLTLAIADFPALRQMAGLAVAGLAGAYFTVLFWMPALLHKQLMVHENVINWITTLTEWIQARRVIPVWLIASSIVVVFIANVLLKNSQDDIKIMRSQLPALAAIDTRIQTTIGEFPNSQFFLVRAESPHAMMRKERQLINQIKSIKSQQGRVSALSQWLPDIETQQQNHQLLKNSILKNQTLDAYIATAGLPVAILSDYRERLATTPAKTMQIEEFVQSPLGKLHEHLWIGKHGGHYYSIVSLYGFQDLSALNQVASELTEVYFIDRAASVSNIFEKYRVMIEKMFPVVLFVIFILLSWRYGLTGSLRVVSAPLLSALLSFLCINLISGEYNLFVIFGLVITVAISIDYAVFISESRGDNRSTYLAISLAGLTTMLALGLLSLSRTPALSFFGLTLLFGVIFSFVITPLIVKPERTPG
jgi:predicted exporter